MYVCVCNHHVQMDSMDSEVETLEQRLTSMLGQLQVECGILERMVYKNKNQHRRCLYFQYLMKVYILYFPYLCLVAEKNDKKTRKENKFVALLC